MDDRNDLIRKCNEIQKAIETEDIFEKDVTYHNVREINLEMDLWEEFYYFLDRLTFSIQQFETTLFQYLYCVKSISLSKEKISTEEKKKNLTQYRNKIKPFTLSRLIDCLNPVNKEFSPDSLKYLNKEIIEKYRALNEKRNNIKHNILNENFAKEFIDSKQDQQAQKMILFLNNMRNDTISFEEEKSFLAAIIKSWANKIKNHS